MDKKNEIFRVNREEIPLGQGRCFIVGTEEIAIFRPRLAPVCALSNRCPHKNAPLSDGIIDQVHVICPYHGRKFNLKTGKGSEPGDQLKTYEVTQEGETIILKT